MTVATTARQIGNFEKLQKVLKLVTHGKCDKDKASKMFHAAYDANHISRQEYHDLFNELEPYLHHFLSDRELSTALKRIDWRTLGEFALTIYDNTLRERILADAWVNALKEVGSVGDVVLRDYGMDNRGTLVFGMDKINHQSDFTAEVTGSSIALPNGNSKLEVKYCPTDAFLTFKTQDLMAYAKSGSYVLTIMGKKKMIGSNGSPDVEFQMDVSDLDLCSWGILTPGKMAEMLDVLPERRYAGYMGNKPCVRVYKDDSPSYSSFMDVRNWN